MIKMDQRFDDGIRVLGYGNLSKLETMMSRHFFFQLKEVSDEVTEEPRTIAQLNRYIGEGNFTHLFVPDEHFHQLEGNLKGCNVPVVELLGDHWVPWAIGKKREYVENNGVNHIIVFTDRFLEEYGDITNFYAISTGFDEPIFTDQDMERDIDVLISGSLGGKSHHTLEYYPVRNWLARVLPEIGEKEGLKVEVLDHPGYFPEDKVDYQQQYANILNQAKIAVGGTGYCRIPFKKLYEAAACGAILLSDLPVEDADFFKGRILEIDPERINSPGYEDFVREMIIDTLADYDNSKERFQPFRSEQDRFDRSYTGKALEMRVILQTIE